MECSRKKGKLKEGGVLGWKQCKINDKSGSGGDKKDKHLRATISNYLLFKNKAS